ncbi:Ubiquitin-conjugating enzyme E2 36 [Platanthera zijinensis]|uniref:Ubiquitin-conjugating enzyme E2 36 n=1 Tax=Platanthera zijinensis TaxID=2320716 RepID=A0AAP0BIF3_9ASPA
MEISLPKGKGEDRESCSDDDDDVRDVDGKQTVGIYDRHRPTKRTKITKKGKGKAWVIKKKNQMRNKGSDFMVSRHEIGAWAWGYTTTGMISNGMLGLLIGVCRFIIFVENLARIDGFRAPGISTSPSEENMCYFNVMILGPSQPPYEGCGSGISGETLSEYEHHWIGFDISQSMLDVALEREVEGDLLLADMGAGVTWLEINVEACVATSFWKRGDEAFRASSWPGRGTAKKGIDVVDVHTIRGGCLSRDGDCSFDGDSTMEKGVWRTEAGIWWRYMRADARRCGVACGSLVSRRRKVNDLVDQHWR